SPTLCRSRCRGPAAGACRPRTSNTARPCAAFRALRTRRAERFRERPARDRRRTGGTLPPKRRDAAEWESWNRARRGRSTVKTIKKPVATGVFRRSGPKQEGLGGLRNPPAVRGRILPRGGPLAVASRPREEHGVESEAADDGQHPGGVFGESAPPELERPDE